MNVALLNCSILTTEGEFIYQNADLKTVKKIIGKAKQIVSAIGHQSTADILSKILDINVPMNRIQYKQEIGDVAIVFKLNGRPAEGKILSEKEIEDIGYSFGVLRKIDTKCYEDNCNNKGMYCFDCIRNPQLSDLYEK